MCCKSNAKTRRKKTAGTQTRGGGGGVLVVWLRDFYIHLYIHHVQSGFGVGLLFGAAAQTS